VTQGEIILIEIIQAIILGVVQGLTEFLPVSSSGHLVLVPWYLGWSDAGFLFDTLLHWGTLVALFVVFWRDYLNLIAGWFRTIGQRSLADPDGRLAWLIILGTIPAVITGLLLKDFIESLFTSARAVGFFMLVTSALLALSEQMLKRWQQQRTITQIRWLDALIIGCFQAIALAPGISRSGSTMAAGLMRGIQRADAARFSFLLGTPAFLGAPLLQLADIVTGDVTIESIAWLPMLAGFVAAAITGVLAIRWLLGYLRNHSFYVFSIYTLVVGLITIAVSFVR
jgi:undecaprenyl-diphosphatase